MGSEKVQNNNLQAIPADKMRNYWATPNDFLCACMGLALKLDIFLLSWHVLVHMGISAIVPYLISWAVYVVPLLILQTYLGQFSNSGFISCFRISPVFKVMGYVSLAVNLTLVSCYSVFAAIPMLYLVNSFRSTLPWSCEAFAKWWSHFPEAKYNICNVISPEQGGPVTAALNETKFIYYRVPSILFFRSYFNNTDIFVAAKNDFNISFELLSCSMLTWIIVGLLVYKFFNAQEFGKLVRQCVCSTLSLLLLCIVRFMFLPGVLDNVGEYFHLNGVNMLFGFFCAPMYIMSAMGPGWGAIVSLASYNKFKTNITRYSWIIGLGQMLVFLAFSFTVYLIDVYFAGLIAHIKVENHIVYSQADLSLYLGSASAIASMSWPNLWSIIFYTMLTLAAITVMVIQTNSILVSLFDEYEFLRMRQTSVTFALVGTLSLFSIYFSSSHGVLHFSVLSFNALFTQCGLNLLLIFVVLWIYGRANFQSDMQVMLGRPFATWKVNVIRILTPLCLCVILVWIGILNYFDTPFHVAISYIYDVCIVLVPWLFIPIYVIYYICKSQGSLKKRFKSCCEPTGWQPVSLGESMKEEPTAVPKSAS